MQHWQYFKYVMRHKYYVFIGCLKLGASFWQALIHDWSKLTPSEWKAYANYFYGVKDQQAFDYAWNHHQKINKHHWQYWLLLQDSGQFYALPMPEKYIREMVADWYGAGNALNKPDIIGWYETTKSYRLLHPDTQRRAEELLQLL